MPGPSNARKKRKSQGKGQTKKSTRPLEAFDATQRSDTLNTSSFIHSPIDEGGDDKLRLPTTHKEAEPVTVGLQDDFTEVKPGKPTFTTEIVYDQGKIRYDYDGCSDVLLQKPYIHDPGNGPRVRDTRAFLASKYFAQPPALDDPLCAEFAQEEVLQMLLTVLPEEMALILWYNKSRATSRICPACQRLYHVGDVLPDHAELIEDNPVPTEMTSQQLPQLRKEQHLSGLCSSMCFILASFNQCDPRTTRNTWGHTGDEIDDSSWAVLNGPSRVLGTIAKALVMIIRMTRLDDLGLAQLCFPDAVDYESVYSKLPAKGGR